jgi:hypothetical protein
MMCGLVLDFLFGTGRWHGARLVRHRDPEGLGAAVPVSERQAAHLHQTTSQLVK